MGQGHQVGKGGCGGGGGESRSLSQATHRELLSVLVEGLGCTNFTWTSSGFFVLIYRDSPITSSTGSSLLVSDGSRPTRHD